MNNPLAQLIVFFVLNTPVFGFLALPSKRSVTSRHPRGCFIAPTTNKYSLVVRRQSRDWIDEVEYVNDEEYNQQGPPVPPDMKYIPRNVMRQHKNFVAIRQAGGKELTNDVYIREPNNSDVFWYVGKVARVSDVTVEQTVCRQWPIIEMHGASLRPIELFPSRGSLEIWTAPGDSEMEVAYNNPDLVFTKMERSVNGADAIKNALIGFQGEMYQGGEEGFRTWRNQDGRAARPPIKSPDADQVEKQIDEEELKKIEERMQEQNDFNEAYKEEIDEEDMKKIEEMLEGQNIKELYKEQQRRAGKPMDD